VVVRLKQTKSNNDGANGCNDGAIAGSNTLVSTGLGLRWQIGSRFLVRLDWGIPLSSVDRQGDSLQDNGIYFSIRVQHF